MSQSLRRRGTIRASEKRAGQLAQATATMPPTRATLTGAIDIVWRGIGPS